MNGSAFFIAFSWTVALGSIIVRSPIARGAARTSPGLVLRVIDSSTTDWCEGDGIRTWRIEVASTARTDTLQRIVQPWPIVVNDTIVLGVVAVSSDCDRRLFRHNATTGRTIYYRVPADMWGYFWDVSASSDGRYVVYLAMDSIGRERAVVRRWPAGSVVILGPLRDGCECDVDRHHAHWVTPDSFELATRISRDDLYERISGVVSQRRVHIDTLTTKAEYWHAPLR